MSPVGGIVGGTLGGLASGVVCTLLIVVFIRRLIKGSTELQLNDIFIYTKALSNQPIKRKFREIKDMSSGLSKEHFVIVSKSDRKKDRIDLLFFSLITCLFPFSERALSSSAKR